LNLGPETGYPDGGVRDCPQSVQEILGWYIQIGHCPLPHIFQLVIENHLTVWYCI